MKPIIYYIETTGSYPGSGSRRNFDTEADLFKKCTVPDQDSGKKDSIPGKS